MGLVVASAAFDLDTFPAARAPQGPGRQEGEFASVLSNRLGRDEGSPVQSNSNKKLKDDATREDSLGLDDGDAATDDAAAGTGLPLVVATWLATTPLLDPIAGSGATGEDSEGGAIEGVALPATTDLLSLPGDEATARADVADPAADLGAVVDGDAPAATDNEFSGVEASAPAATAGDDATDITAPAEAIVEPSVANPVPSGEVQDGAVATVPPAPSAGEDPEVEDAPAAILAPGRHVEQSNRPEALPGNAGANAIEVLQRVAAKHEEQGKAPPGQEPGGNGMPAVAASVVRSVGNAETGTSTWGGESQGQKHSEQGDVSSASAIAAAGANAPGAPESAAAAEAAPVEANSPVAPEPPLEQVGRAVLEQVSEGGGEVRMRLDPPELGEIAIRVRIENQQVRVDIRVERPEALQLLRNAQVDLSSLLGDRGLNLADMFTTLSQGQPGSAWGDETDRQNGRSQDQGFAAILGIDEPAAAVNQHRKLRGAYNPDGAHDYRV